MAGFYHTVLLGVNLFWSDFLDAKVVIAAYNM